jgi:hypothetical protein
MHTSTYKIIFAVYLTFIWTTAAAQSPKAPELDYNQQYDSFVQNYNTMVDIMLHQATDSDASIVSLSKDHLPFLEKAIAHLSNCISVAPNEKAKEMLYGHKEKLDFLHEF